MGKKLGSGKGVKTRVIGRPESSGCRVQKEQIGEMVGARIDIDIDRSDVGVRQRRNEE